VQFRVGPNPGVVSHAIAGLLRWTAGLADAATASMTRALDLATELEHPYSQGFALHHATLLDLWRSDLPSVADRARESRRLADAHDYAIWRALALVFHGVAAVGLGYPDEGVSEMEEGFAQYEELSTPPIFWPTLLTIRAATHGAAGHVDRALSVIERASAGLDRAHPAGADVAITHGDLLLTPPSAAAVTPAAALFEQAAALSADRRARMLELQALTRLARLRRGPARDDARRRLRDLYETFTEGHDCAPLRAAAASLTEDE
jgi:hypothetical protein